MSRGPWKKGRKHYPRCISCGELLHSRLCQSQTCRSPECRAFLLLHPEAREDRGTTKHTQPPKRKEWTRGYMNIPREIRKQRGGLSMLHGQLKPLLQRIKELEKAAEEEPAEDWEMLDDERGIDAPGSWEAIWGQRSRVTVLIELTGDPGRASLVIRKRGRPIRDVIVEALELGNPYLCRVFFAWRCPCPVDHQVVYRRIDDVPDDPGYHDPCERCGAAPLEVLS